ncbi:centrosomal protein of 78 kDa isoform X2 [Syngnathus scovelli]|uniref:centrosomal protein of 78 kDa isoform X2 n=1 Tax=Syngnathus scovelli TaxID=161590 RepID=UPI0021103173|nr:centrosomal protein of 78 kDa isoform X2 [Syngnathus scovelli]
MITTKKLESRFLKDNSYRFFHNYKAVKFLNTLATPLKQPKLLLERSGMVHESVEIKKRGAHDFMEYYTYACTQQKTLPLSIVKLHLDKGILDFNGDRVKLADWPPILDSIFINRHLHHIAITSTYQTSHTCADADRRYYKPVFRKKIPSIRSKDMTFKLCKVLKECLSLSPNLKTLKLNGLPLRERDLVNLTKGVAKSVSLQSLSLAHCPLSDDGLEVICQSVKYSTRIKEIDFTGCNITWRGAEHLANIIQHQGMQRHGSVWAQSLRYQQPKLEAMGGLRRLTLNCNTLIGDVGATRLARELAEDLWLKAVDLQKCGLSNRGACHLLEVLKTNSTLCILDIRNNPLVDNALIKTIIEKVLTKAEAHTPEYYWITPATKEQQKAGASKRRVPSRASTEKTASQKTTSAEDEGSVVAKLQQPTSRCRNAPRHSAARAGRQRGFPPADAKEHSFQSTQQGQAASNVRVTFASDSEEEEDGDEEEGPAITMSDPRPSNESQQDSSIARQMDRMQMALQECRLRLGEERRARLKFELENARLRDNNISLSKALATVGSPDRSALEDEDVLESIERSFAKFHAFLDLVNDAGLGQIASMAGIDKSDFSPLGRPQLSSTLGHVGQLNGVASGQRHSRDIQATRVNPNDVMTPKSPASNGNGDHRDGLLHVTVQQDAGAQVDLSVIREQEPDQFSKPETQYDSDSDRSLASQQSRREYCHNPGIRPSFVLGDSHHRNGFNSSHSDSSHGCRLSSGDSIRDLVSYKAHSGSEGSERKTSPDILEEITSMVAL